MNSEQASTLLTQLKDREINELHIQKQDFMVVRKVLIEREDFKHFRGNAQRGGDVIYTYVDVARS